MREHLAVLAALGADAVTVRRVSELDSVDGLVIPGGESSVIDKLARAFGLMGPLRERVRSGMPVYGTCAGLIMLADRVRDGIAGQESIGGLDATVQRNVFGRQNESFETDLDIPELGAPPVRAVFIRAPAVLDSGPGVTRLADLEDGRGVAVEQGAILGTSFHPEVTGETRFHERFLRHVRARHG